MKYLLLLLVSNSLLAETESFKGVIDIAVRIKKVVQTAQVSLKPVTLQVGGEVVSEDANLTNLLQSALKSSQVDVVPEGQLVLIPTVTPRRDPATDILLGATLTVNIVSADDEPFRSISKVIQDRVDTALLMGLTGDLVVDPNQQDSGLFRLDLGRRNPPVIGGTTLFSSPSQLHGLQFAVWENGQYVPRPIRSIEGQPFVTVKPGENYALFLHQKKHQNAAVSIFIDSLSVFAYQKGSNFSKFAIPAGSPKPSIFTGWYIDSGSNALFQVAPFSQSEAGKQGLNQDKAGLISVVFYAATSGGQPDRVRVSRPPEPLGTKMGALSSHQALRTDIQAGQPESVISLRYFAE